jgi:uncharacterized protein (TIGR02246 family)
MSVRLALPVMLALSVTAPVHAQSPDLSGAAATFGRAWRARDAETIVQALAPDGVRLQLVGERPAGLPARQARAALSEFLAARSQGSLQDLGVQELGGTPPVGRAEFRWQTVVQGTTEPMTHTIFVSFTRGDGVWRINEIRVF